MKRVWVLGGAALIASCTLLNPLDDFTGGPDVDAGPLDASAADVPDSNLPKDADAPVESKYHAAVMLDTPVGDGRVGENSRTVAKDELGLHDGTYVGGVTLATTPTAFSGAGTPVTLERTRGRIVISDGFGFSNSAGFS